MPIGYDTKNTRGIHISVAGDAHELSNEDFEVMFFFFFKWLG
jgi:hypothetical protein